MQFLEDMFCLFGFVQGLSHLTFTLVSNWLRSPACSQIIKAKAGFSVRILHKTGTICVYNRLIDTVYDALI